LITYHFASLAGQGLVHAVFTRLGGVSRKPFATLNVGRSVGDEPAAVEENLARILARLDLSGEDVATAHQIHGNKIVKVTETDGGQVQPGTDGLITDTPGLALLLRFADCQPILLYDAEHHGLGLVHAGWRGLALGIARRAVEAMQEAFGTRPQDLLVGLGPAIGPCCYTVGDDVAAAMGYSLPRWREVMQPVEGGWRLDLSAANAQQLYGAGVQHAEQAELCTACHVDQFFSHRAEGGQTGRFAAIAYLKPHPEPVGAAAEIPSPAALQPEGEPGTDALQPPGFPTFGEIGDASA